MPGKKWVSSTLIAAAALAALGFFYVTSAGRRPAEDARRVPEAAVPAAESAEPAAISTEPAAPPAQAADAAAAAPGWTLQGIAVDEKGSPLSGVAVTLRKEDGGEVISRSRTGADGAFSIAGVAPRLKVVLELEAPGRVSRSLAGEVPELPAGAYQAKQMAERLLDLDEIELGPPCELTVLLDEEEAGPVEGATFEFWSTPGAAWASGMDFRLAERDRRLEPCGEPGTYRAAGMLAGRYLLFLKDERYPAEFWELRLPRERPLRLTLKRGWSTTGTVTGPGGRPVAGAKVVVGEDKTGGTRREVVTGATGEFESPGLSGACLINIQVVAEGFIQRLLREVPPGVDIPIRLSPGVVVTGRAITALGGPAAGARVQSQGRETLSGRDGSFALTGLESRSESVEVHHPEHGSYYSEAVTLGAEERRDLGRVVLKPREAEETLQDESEADGPRGALRIEVVDSQGRPIPKATVSANLGSWRRSKLKSWRTDRQGILQLRGLRAGEFSAEAKAPYFLPKSFRFDVKPDATGALRVELEAAGALSGRVVARGQPVPGALVRAFSGEFGRSEEVKTDLDGRFEIGELKPGTYSVSAYIYGDGGEKENVIVEPGRTTDAGDIRIPLSDEVVTGQVVDEDGRPVAGAFVSLFRWSTDLATDLTDAEGSFRVRGLRRGKPDIVVRKTGFLFPEQRVDVPSSGLKLVLEREQEVQGRVIDATSGQPVAGASVLAFPRADILVGHGFTWEREITGAEGRFLFGSPAKGSRIASLIIEAKGFAERPVVLSSEKAEELTVPLERAVLFRARVVDAAGRPCTKANASLVDPRTGFHGRVFEANGSGELECGTSAEGPRRLLVEDSGAIHSFELEVRDGSPTVVVQLPLPGKLRVRCAAPLDVRDVTLLRDGADVTGQWKMLAQGRSLTDEDEEGAVVFRALAPGRYTCRARRGEALSPAVAVEVFSQQTSEVVLENL